jgi:hypothetical protein
LVLMIVVWAYTPEVRHKMRPAVATPVVERVMKESGGC